MASELIVARHAETQCSVSGVLNGDPSRDCPLTDRGIEQAEEMGRRLTTVALELAVTTEFERTISTADIALRRRRVRQVVEPLLNDPSLGELEGLDLRSHRAWLEGHDWTEAPPGGESQLQAVARYVAGWKRVLASTAGPILVVAHAFPISFALTVAGEGPAVRRRYTHEVHLAHLLSIDRKALGEGLERAAGELDELGLVTGARHDQAAS